MATACAREPIHNLPLGWRDAPASVVPTGSVAAALSAVPISLWLRDARPDPTFVGIHEQKNLIVRTTDNVGQYCSSRMGDMLRSAGARMTEQPAAVIEADLLEYRVDEGEKFRGLVRIRVTVRRSDSAPWTKTYDGTNTRWGATHNPENFNEALSGSLAALMKTMLYDEEFARAIMPVPGAAPPPPAAPPQPPPPGPGPQGS